MNVLVTGGTGFVGGHIVHELQRVGHRVYLLTRNPHSRSALETGAEIRVGNILDATSLARACDGMDAVIHLVGIISEVGEQTFENVHTRGTEIIVSAAKKAGVKRFVHMSALGTRPNAVARYHKSKWDAEEIVRASGLDWTIFRPSIIYGPGDGFVNLFAKMIRRSPIVPIIGSGRSKLQPVPVESVASAFVKSLGETRAIEQTYDLCGEGTFTFNELIDEILKVIQRRRFKLHIPLAVARCQAAFLEFLFARLLRRAPPLNRDQIIMLQEDNVGNPGPTNALFGLKPTSFREAIAVYIGNS